MEALAGRGAPSSIEVGVQDGGPTWESLLLSTPRLLHPNLFGPSLGLTLLGGVGFSSFHHLFALLLPFPFEVSEFKSDGQGVWRGGKPSLGFLPRRVSP